ncbi:MAG: hypothetical protein JWL59_2226 [Chthoniobacteraceae bacterium]|nr:hypothetical protein [Chthoniobacteraceae bacterium]
MNYFSHLFQCPRYFLFLCGAVALVVARESACAEMVELASSPPAGYFAVELNGASDNHVSVPLFRAATTYAKVTAVQPNQIICAAAGFTPRRFATGIGPGGVPQGAYHVEFTSGHLKGVSYRILDNSGDGIVVETEGDDLTAHPLGALAFGDTVRIRPAWTVGSLFGNNEDEVIIEKQPNDFVIKDSVLLYDQDRVGTNKAPSREFFYVEGEGWRVRGGGVIDMGEQPIGAGEPFLVRRKGMEALSMIVVGVPLREQAVVFVQGASATQSNDFYVALAQAEPVRLNASGLVDAVTPSQSVVQSSPSILRRTDLLLEWANGQAGFNRAPARIYYYLAGQGWRQAGSASTTVGNDVILEPGRAYIIRKAIGNPGKDWVQPMPVTE